MDKSDVGLVTPAWSQRVVGQWLRPVRHRQIAKMWIEHPVVGMCGAAGLRNSTFADLRIRDTMADGIHLTNGSQGHLVSNDAAPVDRRRQLAPFAAPDHNGGELRNSTIFALAPFALPRPL